MFEVFYLSIWMVEYALASFINVISIVLAVADATPTAFQANVLHIGYYWPV